MNDKEISEYLNRYNDYKIADNDTANQSYVGILKSVAAHAIEFTLKSQEWRSVEDEFPDICVAVLVSDREDFNTGFYNGKSWEGNISLFGAFGGVTHWKPIELPKAKVLPVTDDTVIT